MFEASDSFSREKQQNLAGSIIQMHEGTDTNEPVNTMNHSPDCATESPKIGNPSLNRRFGPLRCSDLTHLSIVP